MTDASTPPLGPDDGPLAPGAAEAASEASDDDLAPRSSPDSAHLGVLELSAVLDRVLTLREMTVASEHLADCTPCSSALERLGSAQRALAAGGKPSAPAGAADVAVAAALSSMTRGRRSRTVEPSPGLPAGAAADPPPDTSPAVEPATAVESPPALETAASAGPDSSTGSGMPTDRGTSDSLSAVARSGSTPRPAQPVSPSTSRAPWMPASWDADSSKQRALRRHRQTRIGAQAAVGMLVLGLIGAGVYGLTRPGTTTSSASKGTVALVPATHHAATSLAPTTTLPSARPTVKPPPAGALALQLRPVTRAAGCSNVGKRKFVSIDGSLVAVNPATAKPTVMQVPTVSGQPNTCIAVGPAFATAWSGDVTDVAVQAIAGTTVPTATTATGAPVHLVFYLGSGAVNDPTTLSEAMDAKVSVVVIAQGVDIGTAVVTKRSFVTITAAPLVATFIREQLLPRQHS